MRQKIMDNLFKKIAELKEKNEEAYLSIVTKTKGITSCREGAKMLIFPDGKTIGTIGGGEVEFEIIKFVKERKIEKPQTYTFNLTGKSIKNTNSEAIDINSICGGIVEVFVEPLNTKENLYIIGGGHCAVQLSEIASKCGFFVTVVDNRKEWATREKHPYAQRIIISDFEKITETIELKQSDYVVIMTPKHNFDKEVLKQLVNLDLKYLGMMGSLHKVKEIFKQLKNEGIGEEKLKKVYAPIGFPIESKTPEEIAVSITAQLIAVKNNIKEIEFSSNPLLK
ncbi:xanthine dehydrogenase accessory factor [Thermotomaculum hydrothermale]|uniref:Xanthine dehydrogenase accessory factor n=1 Tax=Thermotomaculum hydrothermale TaxID=981385 RepID=A0A7R6PKP8_9BACT|nr:XdhC family protein [Thermotomaculum hydrothermale]BBB31927.1 xanthine dehydrogenase accessory factor [Thermotomaculum hydrothermale]